MRLFHGTASKFDRFALASATRVDDRSLLNLTACALFFSEDPAAAEMFAKDRALYRRIKGERARPSVLTCEVEPGNVLDLTVNSEAMERLFDEGRSAYNPMGINPYTIETFETWTGANIDDFIDIHRTLDDPSAVDALKEAGYDSVILRETGGSLSYAVFDPERISILERKAVKGYALTPELLDQVKRKYPELGAVTAGAALPPAPQSAEGVSPVEGFRRI